MRGTRDSFNSGSITSAWWLFTWNNYAKHCIDWCEFLDSVPGVSYMVYGLEKAPGTGTEHLQGYVEFATRTKLSTLKNLYAKHATWAGKAKTIHWEIPKHYDNWKQCRDYSIKEGNETHEKGGEGRYDRAVGRAAARASRAGSDSGKRTDLDVVRSEIRNGNIKTLSDLENMSQLTAQGLKFGERLLERIEPVRLSPPRVFWLYGATGCGKSRYSRELAANFKSHCNWSVWQSVDNTLHWFNGYAGQEIAIFDDFRGMDCKFSSLLRVADRYVSMQQIKGSTTWWYPKIIFFTSCRSIADSFDHLPPGDDIQQFIRRVSTFGGGEFNFGIDQDLTRFRGSLLQYCEEQVLPSTGGPSAEHKEPEDAASVVDDE